jgi:hypothetical protein
MAIRKNSTVSRKDLLENNYKYIRKSLEHSGGFLNSIKIGGGKMIFLISNRHFYL